MEEKKYTVVQKYELSELIETVNLLIEKWYSCIGWIAVDIWDNWNGSQWNTYYQAMQNTHIL